MAGQEQTYNTNTNSYDTRDTVDASDMAKAKPSTYVDPKTSPAPSQGAGSPDRKDFPDGLPGDAAYAKAVRRYQTLKATAQTQVLGSQK